MFTALTKVDKGMTQPQLDSAFIFFVTHYLCTLDKKDTKSTNINRLSKFDEFVMYIFDFELLNFFHRSGFEKQIF